MSKYMGFSIVSTALILLIIRAAKTCDLSKDYCSLCPAGETHVACKPPKSQCSTYSDVSFTQFTAEQQNYIVQLHNFDRNRIASGSNSRFKPAARMATLIWNCELSYLALQNVYQCAMIHDQCRRIDNDPWVGQNLAYVVNWGEYYNDTTAIEMSIALWFNENINTTQQDINKLPQNINEIGHFTQMMQDRCVSVGCATAKYRSGNYYYSLLACNYWFGNVYGQPVYKTSTTPGSSCTTKTNPQYKALCSTKEKYDFGGLISNN